jgi:hypothetical protein
MKNITSLLLLAFSITLQAQNLSGPESVDCDTSTNTYYVGNTISRQILKRNPNGSWGTFISNISGGPYGIEVVGDRIYACAGTKINGYNLSDGSLVFSVTTTGIFLNGLTHDDNGFLYATDFTGKRIYKINISSASSSVFVPTMTVVPNGIIYEKDKDRLVFVTWGTNAKVMAVSMTDSTVTTLKTTTFTNIDGIAQDKAGRYYLAHWGGNAVHRYDPDFTQTPEAVATFLNSPADIYYNQKTDTLAIPNSTNNTVRFIGFQPVSSINHLENAENLTVFPNPATDFLTIKFDNTKIMEVKILDALGRILTIPSPQHGIEMRLDIKQLTSGWYQIVAHGDGKVGVGKFMKE